jgi:hypothetical protein
MFGGAPKGALCAAKTEPPVADLPMVRLTLHQAGLGREYVVINLKIDGKGLFDFIVDSGLTTELITPPPAAKFRNRCWQQEAKRFGSWWRHCCQFVYRSR